MCRQMPRLEHSLEHQVLILCEQVQLNPVLRLLQEHMQIMLEGLHQLYHLNVMLDLQLALVRTPELRLLHRCVSVELHHIQ